MSMPIQYHSSIVQFQATQFESNPTQSNPINPIRSSSTHVNSIQYYLKWNQGKPSQKHTSQFNSSIPIQINSTQSNSNSIQASSSHVQIYSIQSMSNSIQYKSIQVNHKFNSNSFQINSLKSIQNQCNSIPIHFGNNSIQSNPIQAKADSIQCD